MDSTYRKLYPDEIEQLQRQLCRCEHWDEIEIAPRCQIGNIQRVEFIGTIRLGAFEKTVELEGGMEKHCGIYDATLRNCTIGDNVYISRVQGCIANYTIEKDVVIENIYQLTTRGFSRFGNGIRVPVLNEGGGREVPIFDHLSAQMAYILAMYRHQSGTQAVLSDLIEQYARSVSSDSGVVGSGTHIRNCGWLSNLRIGNFARLHGVIRATEGTINSNQDAPSILGDGTIADEFILSTGASITDGALIKRCFVGQGCLLGKQFSAENSLFFANCEGFHGEACSIFAGPHTVTHHKSTLLIAGYYSFFNAGSGSNQSNHMYKLGPVHQGILGRGTKTTSESYLMWPSRTGLFTLVKGHHEIHFNSEDLPFSYLLSEEGISYLIPGANMQNVGTLRDIQKWTNRDRRTDPDLLDVIHYDLLNPYTIGCILRGEALLQKLRLQTPDAEYFDHQGVRIKKNALERGLRWYSSFIDRYIGQTIVECMEQVSDNSPASLQNAFPFSREIFDKEIRWVDLAGMLAPITKIDQLCEALETGNIKTLQQFEDFIKQIDSQYRSLCSHYFLMLLQTRYNHSLSEIEPQSLISLVEQWKQSEIDLDRMIRTDISKEFYGSAIIGYGIDGDQSVRQTDFDQVRGTMDMHPFVKEFHQTVTDHMGAADLCLEKLRGSPTKGAKTPAVEMETAEAMEIDRLNEANSMPPYEKTLADRWQEDMSNKMPLLPLGDLSSGIGLNDKFLFTRELFKSNPSLFSKTVSVINQADNLEDAMNFLITHFRWDTEQPTVQKFLDLVKRRHLS